MGILGFLKKEKTDKTTELPPLPDMSSLPPLPEMPNEPAPDIPSPPTEQNELNWDAAETEDTSLLFPDMPEDQEQTEARPSKKEDVPDKVPELGDLPEPPSFRLQQQEVREIKPLNLHKPSHLPEPRPAGIPQTVPQLEGFPQSRFIHPEQPHLKRHRAAQGPLFVRMDEYKTILEDIENMRNEFKENENIYTRLNDRKTEQDKTFERFHNALEDIQRKLLYMDKTFFDTE